MGIQYKDLLAPPFHAVSDAIDRGDYTYYLLKGGRGSTKSSFVSLEIILGMMMHPEANAIALRKVGENLADSVYQQLLWAISMLGRSGSWQAKRSPLELVYKPTGQRILFRGLDEPEKIKSITTSHGYFRYLWIEEFSQISGEDEFRNVCQSVMRGADTFTVFLTYNPPRSRQNWCNLWAMEPHDNMLIHHSDYRDVPAEWLGVQFLVDAECLRVRKPESYRHEYLGEAVGCGGQVFDNLTTRPITDDEIARMANHVRGLDFGYAVDPTAYLVANYDRPLRRLTILHEDYAAGAKYDTIAQWIQAENTHNARVVADSAEPRSIAELNDRGLWIDPAKKGPGSVEHGILWLQGLDEIVIDPERTPNTYREMVGYEYAQDRHGNFRADFPDKDNHTIDALRYACEDASQPEPDNRPVSARGHRISTAERPEKRGKRYKRFE